MFFAHRAISTRLPSEEPEWSENKMPSEGIDYTVVLANLEAKRTAIDSAIGAVRQILNLGAEQGVAAAASEKKKELGTDVRFDSFFGMSVPDAIRKFLAMSKRSQALSDICRALQEGGLPTTSKNLMGVVGPTLSRMKSAGELISVKRRWGLSEWYRGLVLLISSIGARLVHADPRCDLPLEEGEIEAAFQG
jgi:hypothetical protein